MSTGSSTGGGATTGSDSGEGTVDDTGTSGGEDIDEFPGLSGPVEIIVDDRGIPHIYGQTDADVMYAAGYQQATDRLFQMELIRRRAQGTQAALVGSDKVGQDRTSRMFDLPRWGAANAERLREEDPDGYRLMVAWLAGVNTRVDEVVAGDAPLPHGFGPDETNAMPEQWTMADHSAIAKLMMLGNSNSLERELLTTLVQRNFPEAWERVELARPAFNVPTMPPEELPAPAPWRPGLDIPAKPPVPATGAQLVDGMATLRDALGHIPRVGSNNWAIDGQHTDNGRPLIAGDPHQPLGSPSLMYAQHLNSADAGGTLNVIGWSFVGTAGVQLGHNASLHWTATTNFADVMDIWEVDFDGSNVRIAGESIAVERRDEAIEVAGGDTVAYEVFDVPGYGVLLPDDILPLPIAAPGNALLLNWTGFDATQEERTFMAMATAENIDEFDAAADTMQVGGFNFIAADASGITYRVQIDIPDRGDPSASQMPFVVLDGEDADSYWDGTMLPPEQLPRSRGGARGWLATANNDPWGFTFDGDVSNDPWYYGYFFAAGHRAQRMQDELERIVGEGSVSRQDMEQLQSDTVSPLAEQIRPLLAEAWATVETDPALAEFVGNAELETLVTLITETWDGTMERDQPGALAFHLYLMLLTEDVVSDELSILYSTVLGEETPFVVKIPVLAVTDQYPESEALMGSPRDVLLLQTLSRVVGVLEARYGDVDPAGYSWGDLHGTSFRSAYGEALYGGWWPSDGGEDTVNVSSSRFLDEDGALADRFDSSAGAIFRVVTSFDEDGTPVAHANFPPGNSAEPASTHFDDTRDAWLEDEYSALPFRRSDVEAAAEQTIMLEP
ncbi:MAG: penicillin acylase family protein [Myxococcota bacterium]